MSRGGLALALVVAIAGCPRPPPPAPRPAARLLELARIERVGGAATAGVEPGVMALRARIEVVNRAAAALVLSAVDWEIAAGRPVVRGRADLERAFTGDLRLPRCASGLALAKLLAREPQDLEQQLARRVLYRLPELAASADDERVVFVAEGEKDADALARLGLVATTNPGGAGKGKWLSGYSESLRGREVVILPDNDAPGRDHADAVARALENIVLRVRA